MMTRIYTREDIIERVRQSERALADILLKEDLNGAGLIITDALHSGDEYTQWLAWQDYVDITMG